MSKKTRKPIVPSVSVRAMTRYLKKQLVDERRDFRQSLRYKSFGDVHYYDARVDLIEELLRELPDLVTNAEDRAAGKTRDA